MTDKDRQLLFEETVRRFFAPLAHKLGVPLERLREDVFAVQSSYCTMLIRKGTGHRDDILVTIRAATNRDRDIDDLSSDIGVGVLSAMNGEKLASIPIDTRNGYLAAGAIEADAAEKYALPFLLGQQSDYDAIEGFIQSRCTDSDVKGFRVKNRRVVREEWLSDPVD